MKKIILFICFFPALLDMYAQNADTLLLKIAAEKNDSRRMNLIFDFFAVAQDTDPIQDMQLAKKLLQQAHELEDPISETLALTEIGYAYRSFGNTANGLDYTIKAQAIAEQTDNDELMAAVKINMALYYKDLADYPKTLRLLHAGEAMASGIKNDRLLTWAFMNLGEVYNAMNKTDSALMYSQRAYELTNRFNFTDLKGFICLQLGKVHGKLGNGTLATGYYDLAIKDAAKLGSPKYLNQAYFALAQYYNGINQQDSCVAYASKAIAAVQNTSYSNMSIKPAKLLAGIYESKNSDSTVKYLKMYQSANDSLFSIRTIQHAQVLTFENQLREQQLAEEKEEAEERRQMNIQYVLLALGIIIIIIIFLLLSRSFITNEKVIAFFGVVALLLVFEFLSLLLHPFLIKITHHSPPLMLLASVCIAALLVPLHHRAEVWAIKKMVEKNKQARLAAAKKTIEKLGGDPGQ